MISIFFLFSGGQDSIIFYFFYLLKKNKSNLCFITFQHKFQINNFDSLSHLLYTSIFFQQKLLIPYFPIVLESFHQKSEKILRNSRYQSTFRLKLFYQSSSLLTAHTYSDLIETFFLNLFRTQDILLFPAKFEKKFLFKDFYHQQILKNSFLSFKRPYSVYKKKLKKKFLLKNSIKKKTFTQFSRPLKSVSRVFGQNIFRSYKLPLWVDLTNFSFLLSRNKVRRHILLYSEIYFDFFLKKTKNKTEISINELKKTIFLDYFYFVSNFLCFDYFTEKEKSLIAKIFSFEFFVLIKFLLLSQKKKNGLTIYENEIILVKSLQMLFV